LNRGLQGDAKKKLATSKFSRNRVQSWYIFHWDWSNKCQIIFNITMYRVAQKSKPLSRIII